MKKRAIVRVLLATFLVSSLGCAQKEAVKKEEALAPATSQQPAEPKKEVAVPTSAQASSAAVSQQNAAIQHKDSAAQPTPAAVYFDFDSYILTNESRTILQGNFKALETKPSIQIEGYCDERGSSEYNLALGEKRAKAAQNYLVTLGYPAEKLSFISYGEERPADKGHDEAAWAKNRRSEFKVAK